MTWIRDWRRSVSARWKYRPGAWPWLMSLPARGAMLVVRLLPARPALAFAAGLARLAWWDSRRRRVGRFHLDQAMPGLDPRERDRILKDSIGHLGRTVAETLVVLQRLRGTDLEANFEFEPGARELLQSVREQSAVLVQAHLGGFEAFGPAAASIGLRPGFPMRMPNNYYVGRKLVAARAGWGTELFPRRGAVRHMLRHMKGGGAVILTTDQNARLAPIFVPWFGYPAATERAAAALALRAGAPLLVCWCLRQHNRLGHFSVGCQLIHAHGPAVPASDDAVYQLTLRMHQALETVIRRHPRQYLWVHDRYRTRPEDLAADA